MFVRDLYLEIHEVTTVRNNQSVAEVYETINKSGYRCIPVIDNEGMYKGMIYKVHIMEYLYENDGDRNATIDSLLKHKNETISKFSPFLKALIAIKALPFVCVVQDGKLLGILTQNRVESVLKDAFGMATGGINITLSSVEAKGMIEKLTKTLRGENIEGMFTLDNGSVIARRVVITLEDGKTDEEINVLRDKLIKHGFRILHIDHIDKVE